MANRRGNRPILWPPHVKSWLIGKDPEAAKAWGQEEKGMTEDEMAGWDHQLDARVCVNSGSWWWTGRPGVLWCMGLQRVGHDWVTELNSTERGRGGFPGNTSSKEPTCQCRRWKRYGFDPWVGRCPGGAWHPWVAWLPTPVFLPGESHGQRNLVATVHTVPKSHVWTDLAHKHSRGGGINWEIGIDIYILLYIYRER